jgi:hypothetical protein
MIRHLPGKNLSETRSVGNLPQWLHRIDEFSLKTQGPLRILNPLQDPTESEVEVARGFGLEQDGFHFKDTHAGRDLPLDDVAGPVAKESGPDRGQD